MQATTRITRWQARHWRLRTGRRGRTLTYRELARRGRIGTYPRSPRGLGRALRDMGRATLHPLLIDALLALAGGGMMASPRFTDRATLAADARRLR